MRLPLAIAAAFATAALAGPAFAAPADDIIAKAKCSKCHTATTTKKAPSWASVAEKYKGKADAEAKLTEFLTKSPKVKMDDGSEEEHKAVKDAATAKSLVKFVLAQ